MSENLTDCIFCKIVRREFPASIICEDDKVIAILDIKPFSPGHTLVIPKEHVENIYDIPEDTIAHLYKIVKKLAIAVKKGIKSEGISIIQSNEAAGSQGIFHFHTHIIPRYYGDKIHQVGVIWESGVTVEPEELNPFAEKIKNALGG